MKRFLCILLVFLMVIPSAFALDLESFNLYASIFGEKELDASKAVQASGFYIINTDDCRITFTEEGEEIKRIFVEGDGMSFIKYSISAMMTFDPVSDNYPENAGRFISGFLLIDSTGQDVGQTVSGVAYLLQPSDGHYIFTIGRD